MRRSGARRERVASLPPPRPEAVDLEDAARFINRELSLLEFNRRVLEQAKDSGVPLLERLRFLTISSTNLDEFFEIRVAGLKQQLQHDLAKPEPDGLQPRETLRRVCEVAHRLVEDQYRVLNDLLLPALEAEGIRILRRNAWSDRQRQWISEYFEREVLPVLTPMGIDPAHPFPQILNKSLNFVVSLEGKDAFGRSIPVAIVQAPRVLPRIIPLPPDVADGRFDFVLLSSVIHAHVEELFPGMDIRGCYQFRVTRNSDLWVDEDEGSDLLRALKGELFRRNYGEAVVLEVDKNCSPDLTQFLLEQFELTPEDLYAVDGPVNLNRLVGLYEVDRPDLKYPPFIPGTPKSMVATPDVFERVRQGDLLLHHPFESFAPVVELVRQAARDPNVLAIKQTLYRIGKDSPMAEALLEAARAGKEVIAVIELRARFDEAANIDLATRLQEMGAKVVYGVVGFKAHAKILLVVRREGNLLRRYVHLGTGNYHTANTRNYTDVSLLTCNEDIGEDVHSVFQQLTGLGKSSDLRKILQSPFTLHPTILRLIEAEAENARQGKPARIAAKMNALIEPESIRALYRASQAGVQIDLIVRGMCALRPGVPGLSDHIRVRSIVGRFLEHSRIFHFHAGGEDLVFCGSADWMQRNFFHRVEVCFPVEDRKLRERLIEEGLRLYMEDDAEAWDLQPDGSYRKVTPRSDKPVAAQRVLLDRFANVAVPAKTA